MRAICVSLSLSCLLCSAAFSPASAATELQPAINSWLASQTNLQSWSADFVQTRAFKSLTQPLTNSGHVWFAAPNRFRWELGHPAQTIAIRAPQELLVVYPRLKRVEHFPLNGMQSGPWKDALALLEAGFPRNREELLAQYNVESQSVHDHVGELTLQPKSAAARRMMPQIKISFDTSTTSLRATELKFGDGSTMRNDFSNGVMNPPVDDHLFAPEFPADYKQVEPLKGEQQGRKP